MAMTLPDDSFALLAAKCVCKQLDALTGQLSGIREGADIECIHQARVAARRLGTGIQIFQSCFPAKKVKKWRRRVRQIIKALGPARDKDVQIKTLTEVMGGLEDKQYRPGIARLQLRLKQQRQASQPNVLKAMDRLEKGSFLDDIYAAVGKIRFRLRRHELPLQSQYVYLQANKDLRKRLDRILNLQPCLDDPEDIRRHHQMRMAVKRFRYTMEIYMPVFEKQLNPFHDEFKSVQTRLGEIHDCDVWADQLEAFLQQEHQRAVEYFGHTRSFARMKLGVDYFRENRKTLRNSCFHRLQDHYKQIMRENLWERFVKILEQPLQAKPPLDSAEDQSPHIDPSRTQTRESKIHIEKNIKTL